jgi:hypothetical protein
MTAATTAQLVELPTETPICKRFFADRATLLALLLLEPPNG